MKKKEAATPAPDDSFKKVDLAISDVKTVILTLRATEVEVCSKACEALEAFAFLSDKNRVEVVSSGGLEPLVKLLTSATPALRQLSSLCLSTLVSAFDARQALRKSGLAYLEPLVALLGSDQTPIANENACVVMDRLCSEFSSRSDLLRAGALAPIVGLLGAQQPEVKRAAVRVLTKLLDEYDARNSMISLNALPLLVALLDADFSEVQQLALIAIGKCGKCYDNISALVDLGVMEKIIAFVGIKENKSSYTHALTALAVLLNEPSAIARLAASTPVGKEKEAPPPPLASLIGMVATPDENIQVPALACIAKAAVTPQNRATFLDFKAEAALVARLLSDDPKAPFTPTLVCASCKTLAVLCKSRPNSEVVGTLFGIHKLARLLSNENELVIVAALGTLAAALEQTPANRKLLLESEGIPRLLQLLADFRPESKSNAAACIASLAKSDLTRPAVKSALPALAAAAASDDVPLAREAVRALAVLARDNDMRHQLLADGSVFKTVVALLSHADSTVVRVAALLVAALADEPACVARLTDAGALSALQSLTVTAPLEQNAYLLAAYNRLLDGNLSAKFAVTGVLSVTDIIDDGFYDVGNRKSAFPSLAQLVAEPINTDRPTIVINSTKPDAPSVSLAADPAPAADPRPAAKSSKKEKERTPNPPPAAEPTTPSVPTAADPALAALVAQVRAELLPIAALETRISRLAMLVSEKLGGAVALSRVSGFELDLGRLKTTVGSNVLPVGRVKHGSYRIRSLLFKFLAGHAEIPCALYRADYGHCFAVVHTPKATVVDVMHAPGRLLAVTDPARLAGSFWAAHPC